MVRGKLEIVYQRKCYNYSYWSGLQHIVENVSLNLNKKYLLWETKYILHIMFKVSYFSTTITNKQTNK